MGKDLRRQVLLLAGFYRRRQRGTTAHRPLAGGPTLAFLLRAAGCARCEACAARLRRGGQLTYVGTAWRYAHMAVLGGAASQVCLRAALGCEHVRACVRGTCILVFSISTLYVETSLLRWRHRGGASLPAMCKARLGSFFLQFFAWSSSRPLPAKEQQRLCATLSGPCSE